MAGDLAMSLLGRGYTYEARLADKAAGDDPAVRQVRLLGRPALLIAGREATRFFYDTSRVRRAGAVPHVLSDEIFGHGSVHGLDGSAHARRKRMHLEELDARTAESLAQLTAQEWDQALTGLSRAEEFSLHETLVGVLGAAAQRWAGLGSPGEHAERARDLAAIVDGFGSIGPRHWRGRAARLRCETWARAAICDARAGRPVAEPVRHVSLDEDEHGRLLPVHDAAVELLNLLRPVVAVAWLGSFIPLAFEDSPHWRDRLRTDHREPDSIAFVHELRRHYPFVPMLAGRVVEDQRWYGHTVHAGQRVLLHVVATNHDPRLWPDPWSFRPERFGHGSPEAFSLIAQGGGDAHAGHRCPGEPATVRLLSVLSKKLAALSYVMDDAPRFSPRRMPASPRGGPRLRLIPSPRRPAPVTVESPRDGDSPPYHP